MGIVIPNKQTKQITQYNKSDVLGVLDKSFNLELKRNEGRFKVNRMINVANSDDDDSDIGLAVAFVYYDGDYWFVCDDYVFNSGGNPSTPFSKSTAGSEPNGEPDEDYSDMVVFNGAIYMSGSNEVMKFDGTWSTPITTQLTSSRPHLMTVYKDLLYITDDYYKVHSINTSDTISGSGTSTLDLGLDDTFTITMLKAGYDRIWIGVQNIDDGTGYVYSWDGQTEDVFLNRYDLESGCVAGVIFNNIPYIVDARGRLMAFNGGSFQEVARFPIETYYRFDDALKLNNSRFIHPNGMDVTDYGTILISINGDRDGSGQTEGFIPSGIWEYDPQIGLYHKMSPGYTRSGTTTITDYGQQLVTRSGAVFFKPPNTATKNTNGTLLAGFDYESASGSSEGGVFHDDTLDTTQKFGYFETKWIESNQIEDVWQQIILKVKKLRNSTDKVVVKYKVDYHDTTAASITWSDTSTFTTTVDISDYNVGDEVEITRGSGGGKSAHIESISESGGTYTVSLDDTFTGVSGDSRARFDKWIKAGELDEQNKRWKRFTLNKDVNSPQIKIKVCMQFTGDNEVHELIVNNKTNTKI